MKIQSFVFNWRNQLDSTLAIESSLKHLIEDVSVINSDESIKNKGWVNLREDAYFSDQFSKALELHDGKSHLLHIQGDVSYNNWDTLLSDAEYYINEYRAGIYYPKVLNTVWGNNNFALINEISTEHDNINLVTCGDETVWFIHPEIIKCFKDNFKTTFR